MRSSITHLNQAVVALGLSALLMGCLTDPTAGETATGRVTLEVTTSAVRAQGGFVPSLTRLEVIMVSSKRDTVRDTITRQGSRLSTEPAYLDGVGGFVHLFARYELQAGRSWTLLVRTFDAADTVIHEEAVAVEGLREYEYRPALLQMEPRRLGYAMRVSLPTKTSGAPSRRRPVEFQRVELVVDGVVVRDSLLQATKGQRGDLVLTIPYMRAGIRSVEFRAYGLVSDVAAAAPGTVDGSFAKTSASPTLLLSGATTVQAALSRSAVEQSVALSWGSVATEAADTAETGLQFRIGAVGTVGMNVVISGAVAL